MSCEFKLRFASHISVPGSKMVAIGKAQKKPNMEMKRARQIEEIENQC